MSVEEGEFKPGGTRVGPGDACGACWVRIGRRMWLAKALVQEDRIVGGSRSWGWVLCRSGRRISGGLVWMSTTRGICEREDLP